MITRMFTVMENISGLGEGGNVESHWMEAHYFCCESDYNVNSVEEVGWDLPEI